MAGSGCCATLILLFLGAATHAEAGLVTGSETGSELALDASLLKRPDPQQDVNSMFDVAFADMRPVIAARGMDPLPLPSDEDHFTITLFNRTGNGSISMGDGELRGLSTIHRSGDMTLDYGLLQHELVVGGEVGLTGLEVSYSGNAKFWLMRSKFGFTFEIPFLSLEFKTGVFIQQVDVVLEYCSIKDFSYSHLQLSGFGPVDTILYELVGNTLLQVLNDIVKEELQLVVCALLQDVIQGSGRLSVM